MKRSARSRPAAEIGSIAVANSPAEFAAMLPKETDQWAKALRVIGLAKSQPMPPGSGVSAMSPVSPDLRDLRQAAAQPPMRDISVDARMPHGDHVEGRHLDRRLEHDQPLVVRAQQAGRH